MTSERSRVALYARVSTSDGSQDTGVQLDRLRGWALEKGHGDAGEYVDEASAASDRRPAWKRLEGDWRQGRVRVVVVVDLDRAFRSMVHFSRTFEEWKRLRIRFVNLNFPIDTETIEGELIVYLMAAVAQFYRRVTGRQVKAGMERAERRGARIGRPPRRLGLFRAQTAVRECKSIPAAARHLGVSPSTLRRRLSKGSGSG